MRRTSEPRSLLLDTHVWLWFMLADPGLAIGDRNAINRAAGSGLLRIAAIRWGSVRGLAHEGRENVEGMTG